MTFSIFYAHKPVWRGRTARYRYSLHRAVLGGDVGYRDGYALRYTPVVSGSSDNGEHDIIPGADYTTYEARVTDRPLPAADPKEVQRVVEELAELCAREGTPLEESEMLIGTRTRKRTRSKAVTA